MRITYIQQHFALQTEPGFVRAWEFCRRLVADGHEVTVIRGSAARADEVVSGVRVVSVEAPYENEMRFRRRILSFVQFAARSTWAALRSRPQVVYASSTPLTVALPAIVAATCFRSKFVFEVRDLWPRVPVELGLVKNKAVIGMARGLEKFAYSRASSVVALSPDMAEGVTAAVPGTTVSVVPNGCDLAVFDEISPAPAAILEAAEIPAGGKHIVYAGGFGYMYDLPWCIELAAALAPRGVYFTFIGRGTESNNLVRLAKERGIYRSGMFPGRLPKKEVIRYLKGSDAVFSALRDSPALEACSLNKVFDSMAASKPVFLNHGGWLTAQVVAAGSGWRVSRDVESAAITIESLIHDDDLLKAAGKANRVLGETKYARDDQYAKFKEVVLGTA